MGIKPKRLAGASAGAICAALMATGYNANEMGEILKSDLEDILMGTLVVVLRQLL